MDYPTNMKSDDSTYNLSDSKSGFTAPDGYFESLNARIKMQTSGLLKQDESMPDQVYFDDLKNRILAQTVNKKRNFLEIVSRSPVMRYAAAAVLTGAMILSIQPKWSSPISNLQASVNSQDEVVKYLSESDLNDISLTEFIPANDIENPLLINGDESLIIESL